MEKTVKLIFAALGLWACSVSCAISASLEDGRTKYDRDGHAIVLRTDKTWSWRNSAKAEALLGFKYEHGLGVPQNYYAAIDLYRCAAERGDPTGQYLLGLMYDKGRGMRRDEVLAHMWLNLAAAHAPKRYREYYLRIRDAVASKMTASQIVEAQQLALEWVPNPKWKK
jgi:uncharacterized protein